MFVNERASKHLKPGRPSLFWLIASFPDDKASDRRDMVYALLALTDTEIKADDMKSVAEIYDDVLKAENATFLTAENKTSVNGLEENSSERRLKRALGLDSFTAALLD
jgi:hypothetical protein